MNGMVILDFDKFHKNFMKQYGDLFDINIEDETTEDYTPEMLEDYEQEKQRQKFSWEFLLHKLTNGDITKNDIVLDTFAGSMTTGLSCFKEKRNFIGSEIDSEMYVKANNRLINEMKQLTMF